MDSIDDGDLNSLAGNELQHKLNPHTVGFNSFISKDLGQIISDFSIGATISNNNITTKENELIEQISFDVKFTNITARPPQKIDYNHQRRETLLPNDARRNGFNYSSEITARIDVSAKAFYKDKSKDPFERTQGENEFCFGSIPILVGSDVCVTSAMTMTQKREIQEDPLDPGGYFILKGTDGGMSFEWVINMSESRAYNYPYIFYNLGHLKEISRLELISKPGDGVENSIEINLIYETDDSIYLSIIGTYMGRISIPFYLIYYLFGMSLDKDIIETVVFKDCNDLQFDFVSNKIQQILYKAMTVKKSKFGDNPGTNNISELIDIIANKINIIHETSATGIPGSSIYDYLRTNMLNILDKNFLPHIGLSNASRIDKLRYYGYLIRKLLLVAIKVIDSTSRDSLKSKRVNTAGKALSKSVKTNFNISIVQAIKKELTKKFSKMPFDQVELMQAVKTSINMTTMEANIVKSITTGTEEVIIKDKTTKNRIMAELLLRKNQLNVLATIRNVRTPNKGAENKSVRAHEMRQVDPSYNGYYDTLQSKPTGDGVGLVKQLAITASITESQVSSLVKSRLLEDPDVIPFRRVGSTEIYYENYAIVLVNGSIVGCCRNPFEFTRKYREYRRGYEIVDGKFKYTGTTLVNPMVGIYWDPSLNEINFWCDSGRIVKPLIVVRNNSELDPIGQDLIGSKFDSTNESSIFEQVILITKQDIEDIKTGKKNNYDLLKEGKIDYVYPEELQNFYVSYNYELLTKEKNNPLQQFTHCNIQVGFVGIPALASPFIDHNQPTRATYHCNQCKQSCGIGCLNHFHRIDKNIFTQTYVQEPLVSTLANDFVYPNGINSIVAIQGYTGFNQEDSIIFNDTASNRLLFGGTYSKVYYLEIKKDEVIGVPERAITINIKKSADYSKLVDGVIERGAIIKRNTVLISKYGSIPETRDGMKFKDMSIVYDEEEDCHVKQVIRSRNQDNNDSIKVELLSIRKLSIGGKCSSRAGQKGETGMGLNVVDLPFTESGLVPDIIINPCAIPSRMTIGQLLEGLIAKVCAITGRTVDATVFNKKYQDVKSIGDLLHELGYNRYGTEKMFSGMSGRWIDSEIFITPTFYQLLQKFAVDGMYAVSSGPTCVMTRQPLEGAAKHGGLRIGEMEAWTLATHGTSHFLMEKFRENSDGFDIYVCATCGKMPIVNEQNGTFICRTCWYNKKYPDIRKIRSTWSTKLFIQEIESCGVDVKLTLK
jgi:DNA-directed RNA polymerase beta subunit